MVLRVAQPPQRPLADGLIFIVAALARIAVDVDLEVGARGVEEDHVDLEVEQVGDREEDRLLHPLRTGKQEVHRPIQLVVGDSVDAVEDDVAAEPAGRFQLRRRLQAALADHREDCPLDPGAAAASAGDARDRLADPQLRPQRIDHVRAA